MMLLDVYTQPAIIRTYFMLLLPFICVSLVTGLRVAELQISRANLDETGGSFLMVPRKFPRPSPGSHRHTFSRGLTATERLAGKCTKFDITVLQGETTLMPSGIPTFTVQIFNICAVACPISNIHISCGWFASAKLVNPKLFRRIKYNDCLLNDGKPLKGGESLTFQYSNSFEYPMSVLSVTSAC